MWQVRIRRTLPWNHSEILYPCKGLYRGGASCDEDGEERESFNDSIVAFLAKKEWTRVWSKERELFCFLAQSLSLISIVERLLNHLP